MKIRIVGMFAAVLLVCAAATARADPVVITGGAWINAWELDGGVMTLVSDQFNVSTQWNCGAENAAGMCSFPHWTPGQVIDLSTTTHGPQASGFDATTLHFNVAPFTIPAATPDRTDLPITMPFSMTGLLVFATLDGHAFSGPVVGSGQLSFVLTSFGSNYAVTHDFANFRFSAGPAPTPEPVTAGLLACGLAVVGTRRFRRRT